MKDELERSLIEAALLIDSPEHWKALREAVAGEAPRFGAEDLLELAGRFDRPTPVPAQFREGLEPIPRRTAWRHLWRQVLCELFLVCRDAGLSALRCMAFGDNINGGAAFMLLCRLASLGIERQRFFADVRREFPRATMQARMFMIDSIRRQGVDSSDRALGRDVTRDPAFQREALPLSSLPGHEEAERQLDALGGEE